MLSIIPSRDECMAWFKDKNAREVWNVQLMLTRDDRWQKYQMEITWLKCCNEYWFSDQLGIHIPECHQTLH